MKKESCWMAAWSHFVNKDDSSASCNTCRMVISSEGGNKQYTEISLCTTWGYIPPMLCIWCAQGLCIDAVWWADKPFIWSVINHTSTRTSVVCCVVSEGDFTAAHFKIYSCFSSVVVKHSLSDSLTRCALKHFALAINFLSLNGLGSQWQRARQGCRASSSLATSSSSGKMGCNVKSLEGGNTSTGMKHLNHMPESPWPTPVNAKV